MPSLLNSSGLTSARTAGCEAPPTATCPIPSTCWSFCARIESAMSNIASCVAVSEVSARTITGASAGFTLRQYGLNGKLGGNCPRAELMAACTSRAAASISRSKSNCKTIWVLPSRLNEVIWFTPAMRPNMRSNGADTYEAIVSGLAPGKSDWTLITG